MTRLIYIGGMSRSGSTLLELGLAAHRELFTVGELQVWPHELAGSDAALLCGCGRPVLECSFWDGVRRRVDPRDQLPPRLDHFRETHQWGRTVRPRMLRQFGRRPLGPVEIEQARRYGRNTAALVEAAADQYHAETGVRPAALIDASKDPYRALWLARSGVVDLSLIHLVRDPRGVVHSLTGAMSPRSKRLWTAARRSLAWNLENALLDAVRHRHLPSERARVVRYEDLSLDPVGILAELAEFCGVAAEPDAAERTTTTEVHSIAGNPMRQRRRAIALDTRWRDESDPLGRSLVWLTTTPVRWRHGYRV